MEPHDRSAQALSSDAPSSIQSRLRLIAACAVLVGLAMVQSPGLLVPDTKFDLAIAPAQFLSRAAHLWDPQGAFGQLQNQAYGYLWPMGPFFLLGSVADVPAWIVQRLWLALVMCVALTGAAKVARQLGVRSDVACLLAGFAYALSPRMLTTMGPISIEAWPSALAPWVLLPLMVGSVRGSARRAAALSALAVAMVGGVNAAATSAVLPLGVLWLLTRTPGTRRRTMLIWWPLFTVLGTLWWMIPLFTMGAYSPPFLDFIESASNTTFPTTLFDALRGTSNWVPYVDLQSRAGNDLLRLSYLVLDSGVVLFLGLVGLLQRANPHRLFLALGVLTGMLLVTMGHVAGVHGWLAGDLQSLLDGPLAPLRNVHKFDPVLRLPLVLGLAWLVDRVLDRLGQRRAEVGAPPGPILRLNGYVVVGTATLAVLGASLPALSGRITPAGGMTAVPGYWRQAAAWLGHAASTGTSLLVPGSSFGDYVWGSPHDEPLQSLARGPWAVRNAIPLAPPGNIRMLDAVEERLAQGVASPGLAPYLRRAGVRHLVVRNDLARSNDVPDPVLVHQALTASPGLHRVAAFGPDVGGKAHIVGKSGSRIVVNGGWQTEYPAIEVYAVDGERGRAVAAASAPVVVGGPEDLLDLADLGVLHEQPTVLASDVAGSPDSSAPLVLTDGLRAVERNFGRVHDGASATSVPGEPRRLGNPTRDYLLDARNRWSTTARAEGVKALTASSSMSDADAVGVVQRGELPYAAMDGDPQTAWTANARTDQPAWWRVSFWSPRSVGAVTVTAGPDDREVVRVRTTHGVSGALVVQPGARRTVPIHDPDASWVRVEDASGRVGHRVALAEVTVPGLSVRRSLVLPSVPDRWGNPDQIVLRALGDGRTGCVEVDGDVRCVSGREVAAEEPAGFRRRFSMAAAADFGAALRVRARPGAGLERLLLDKQPVGVSASSTGNPDLRASALAAVDGDPGTTWTASL
ncbi:MAG: alpha-(1-_3)-arabinofuranosyltransferase, partial [Nocardioidaceae bacterium]